MLPDETGRKMISTLFDTGFYLSGEDPRFYKRRVKQYPASLSGGLQSPTEINAPRGCAGIRLGIMSAYADPNPAPRELTDLFDQLMVHPNIVALIALGAVVTKTAKAGEEAWKKSRK